ncbi:MAG: TolC family protein, partial [Planctomycetota bacterium]
AEFETGVRDLVANVENAYWDLYFAYRNLDAQKRARDLALKTYQSVAAAKRGGIEKGVEQNVGQALEQYWRFEAEVQNALNGKTSTGTVSGSSGGVTTSPIGVHLAERRLRLITGLPINGGALLRPSDTPSIVPVSFDWPTLVTEAVSSRPELRRQRWRIKQAELELVGSRNLLLPRLDAIAQYRWRGFGNNLLPPDGTQFSSAYDELVSGDYQEWQLGLELEVPIGYRNAHNAVRNAEHRVARERVVLAEQKRDVVFGLTNAASEARRAFAVAQAQFNRYAAAQQQIEALTRAEQAGRSSVDLTLEAQRRVLDTEILYHQATVDYALALRNVYFETGTLLAYNNVFLTEGASPGEAYRDAIHLAQHRTRPLNYVHRDLVISHGPADR